MAMRKGPKEDWILLIHQLPPKPTNLRVRIWRKLQKLGAVAIKNSVYLLPCNEKTYEDFQWLKQEIESTGGEATVFRAGAVEGATDEEIIAAFRKTRDEEYALVRAELDGITGAINEQKRGGHMSAGRVAVYFADNSNSKRATCQSQIDKERRARPGAVPGAAMGNAPQYLRRPFSIYLADQAIH
jgi:hypothetical protein